MKKLVLVLVPIIIIGVVAGLGFTGVIRIPGITRAKAAKNNLASYTEPKETSAPLLATNPTPNSPPTQPRQTAKPSKPRPKVDLDQGNVALATVWNEVKVAQLIRITADWKDEDLAKVLIKMDTDKVAKVIEEMAKGGADSGVKANPGRASKISRILQKQGSLVKVDGDATNG